MRLTCVFLPNELPKTYFLMQLKSYCLIFLFLFSGKLFAQNDIEAEIKAGNFTKAQSLIADFVKTEISDSLKKYWLDKSEILNRIRRDFNKNENQVLEKLKEKYPNLTPEQVAKWEQDKSLEMRLIDGEKRYFYASVRNFFRIQDFFLKKDSLSSVYKNSLLSFCEKDVPQIIKESNRKPKPTKPVRLKIRYTLTVNPNAVPDGEKIRAWLPFPVQNDRQKDIKILKVGTTHYQFQNPTPSKDEHRSFYMENFAKKDQATVFSYELSYTAYAQWFAIDEKK